MRPDEDQGKQHDPDDGPDNAIDCSDIHVICSNAVDLGKIDALRVRVCDIVTNCAQIFGVAFAKNSQAPFENRSGRSAALIPGDRLKTVPINDLNLPAGQAQ